MYMSLVKSKQYDELWKDFKYLGTSYSINNESMRTKYKIIKSYKKDYNLFVNAKTIFDLPIYREKIHYEFFINYIKNYKYNSKTTDKQLITDYSKYCQKFLRMNFCYELYCIKTTTYNRKDFIKELIKPCKLPTEQQSRFIEELLKWDNNGIID